MTASSTSPTASCDALLLRPQRDGGGSGDPPWEGPWRNPKPGSPTPPSHPPRGMEGKKYKGSCGNRRACRGGWGEPAVGSRLTGASLPPPQLCHYYHLMGSRTHCPPENRSDKCGGRWGLASPHQGPRGSFHRPSASCILGPRKKRVGSWY